MKSKLFIIDFDGHTLEVSAAAGYEDCGIGSYEYWGDRCNDERIEFCCEINWVKMVSRSGNKKREIYLSDSQTEEISEMIKCDIDRLED